MSFGNEQLLSQCWGIFLNHPLKEVAEPLAIPTSALQGGCVLTVFCGGGGETFLILMALLSAGLAEPGCGVHAS